MYPSIDAVLFDMAGVLLPDLRHWWGEYEQEHQLPNESLFAAFSQERVIQEYKRSCETGKRSIVDFELNCLAPAYKKVCYL